MTGYLESLKKIIKVCGLNSQPSLLNLNIKIKDRKLSIKTCKLLLAVSSDIIFLLYRINIYPSEVLNYWH